MKMSQCKGVWDSIFFPVVEKEKLTRIISAINMTIMGRGGRPELAKIPMEERIPIMMTHPAAAIKIFFRLAFDSILSAIFLMPNKTINNVPNEMRAMMMPEISSGFMMKSLLVKYLQKINYTLPNLTTGSFADQEAKVLNLFTGKSLTGQDCDIASPSASFTVSIVRSRSFCDRELLRNQVSNAEGGR